MPSGEYERTKGFQKKPVSERDLRIVAQWNEFQTASEICVAFGLASRNVVIGVISRAREKGVVCRADKPRFKMHKVRRARIVKGEEAYKPSEKEKFPEKRSAITGGSLSVNKPPKPVTMPIWSGERTNYYTNGREGEADKTCKWIVSEIDGADTMFCADRRDGKNAYCVHHRALIYRKPGKSASSSEKRWRNY